MEIFIEFQCYCFNNMGYRQDDTWFIIRKVASKRAKTLKQIKFHLNQAAIESL